MMIAVSREQARGFLLSHQGLRGSPRFSGKEGVLAFTRRVGCVQFDPVNVCGRSPELVYLSRVPGFEGQWLDSLLYRERTLVDHFDKNLAIFAREDWPYMKRIRARWSEAMRSRVEVEAIRAQVLLQIAVNGPQNAASLGIKGRVDWYWAGSTLARAALEQMYYEGELLIHSKKGTLKLYDLAERCLPQCLLLAQEPWPDDSDHAAWHLLRRIRAVGLMWNRASDAWMGSFLQQAQRRNTAFDGLQSSGKIVPVKVEGIKETLYLAAEDLPEMEASISSAEEPSRCELIAPLDSLIWDRKLIAALFDFRYTWEIYTPPQKRVYGTYVLPILLGDRFVGRIEPVCDRKARQMAVKGVWWEEGFKPGREEKRAVSQALRRLAEFNGCRLDRAL